MAVTLGCFLGLAESWFWVAEIQRHYPTDSDQMQGLPAKSPKQMHFKKPFMLWFKL
jgi:hypothetical protein